MLIEIQRPTSELFGDGIDSIQCAFPEFADAFELFLQVKGGVGQPAHPTPLAKRSVFFNDTATTEIYTLSLHDARARFLYRSCFANSNAASSEKETAISPLFP